MLQAFSPETATMYVAEKCTLYTLYYTQSHLWQVSLSVRGIRARWHITRLTQGTYWTRFSSAFFSSVSLFNTARMSSCSSSVRKLRSIMVTVAALSSAFHCFKCVASGWTWSMLYALLLLSSWFFLFYPHKLSQWQCFTHTGSSIIQNDHIEKAFCSHVWHFVVGIWKKTGKKSHDFFFENMGEIQP